MGEALEVLVLEEGKLEQGDHDVALAKLEGELSDAWGGQRSKRGEDGGVGKSAYVFDHLQRGHDVGLFGCGRRSPTQQGGKVEEGGREDVASFIEFHVRRVVTFAQLLPVRIDKQAKMSELRGLPA